MAGNSHSTRIADLLLMVGAGAVAAVVEAEELDEVAVTHMDLVAVAVVVELHVGCSSWERVDLGKVSCSWQTYWGLYFRKAYSRVVVVHVGARCSPHDRRLYCQLREALRHFE